MCDGSALFAVAFGLFMVGLDGSVVSIANPEIGRDLGASTSDLQWVTNSYLLALAAAGDASPQAVADPRLGPGFDHVGFYADWETCSFPPGRYELTALVQSHVVLGARNAALDELRRRKRRASLEADPEDATAVSPAEHAEYAVRREAVRAAVARLAPRERELVGLKFAGGLSNEEIARVVGISASNVGTRLHRTLEKLRRGCDENA